MKTNVTSVLGLLVLLAGAGGVYRLFTHGPAEAEEQEASIETVVPVQTGRIQHRTLQGYEVVYGTIEAAPTDATSPGARLTLRAAIDGVVTHIACRPGQWVEPGDSLFQLDTRIVDATRQQQQQTLDFARREYERQQQLLAIEGTSEQAAQQAALVFHQAEQALAATRVQLEFHTLRAPIAGTVTAIQVAIGESVQATQALADILDQKRQILSVQVPVHAIRRIKRNQPVEVATENADGSTTWVPAGSVDYISPEIDPRNGTLTVRTSLPTDAAFPIGQFVQARIGYATRADCLVVPAAALLTDVEGATTIAVIQNDQAHHVNVHTGLREGPWIEIEGDGLTEGLTIATKGAYGLPELTRVTIIDHD